MNSLMNRGVRDDDYCSPIAIAIAPLDTRAPRGRPRWAQGYGGVLELLDEESNLQRGSDANFQTKLAKKPVRRVSLLPGGPSSIPKNAPRSVRRALLMPQVNPGSLYCCGKST